MTVVSRHEVWQMINQHRALATARHLRIPLYPWKCRYTYATNGDNAPPVLHEALHLLNYLSYNSFEAGLQMHTGMPVLVNRNLAIDQGVPNGARGWIRHIEFDPREPGIPPNNERTTHKLHYPSIYIVIKMMKTSNSKLGTTAEGNDCLPSDCFPIIPQSSTISLKSLSLKMSKGTRPSYKF